MNAYSDHEILVGLVRELRARNIPLGIRDYLDAIKAMRLGFGRPTKQDLRVLCERLWARGESEIRSIDAVFDLIPYADPSDPECKTLEMLLFAEQQSTDRPDVDRQSSKPISDQPGSAVSPAVQPQSTDDPRANIYFEAASHKGGLALPRLNSKVGLENYVFHPQTVASPRQLAVAWRRLRKTSRTGAKLELDVQSTIQRKSHYGVIAQPVLRQSRRNVARLSILFDTSPSMAPWRLFAQVLSNSLTLAKLQFTEIRYFSNVPRKWIFAGPRLDGRVAFEEWATRRRGSALMLVSDAGAARGHFSPQRTEQTQQFLSCAVNYFRPIVWINPMPRQRWGGSTAASIARNAMLTFLPLDKESLIRAVDVLRGARLS